MVRPAAKLSAVPFFVVTFTDPCNMCVRSALRQSESKFFCPIPRKDIDVLWRASGALKPFRDSTSGRRVIKVHSGKNGKDMQGRLLRYETLYGFIFHK